MKVRGTLTLVCMVTVRVLLAVCATLVLSDRLEVFQYPVGKLALKNDCAVATALAVWAGRSRPTLSERAAASVAASTAADNLACTR